MNHSLTSQVPKIPRRPEATIRQEKSGARMCRLEKFLQGVMDIEVYRNNRSTLHFLEISSLSFRKDLGGKERESEVGVSRSPTTYTVVDRQTEIDG